MKKTALKIWDFVVRVGKIIVVLDDLFCKIRDFYDEIFGDKPDD